MEDRGPAAYIAEFFGTLMLVFFICAVVSLYGPEPSPANPNPFIDFGVIGLVHVLLLFVLIQTLAIVSGAHFNTAVTVALGRPAPDQDRRRRDLHRRPARRRCGGRPAGQGDPPRRGQG